MPSPILFFLEFSSPYAYIGANMIEAVAEKHGRGVVWKPISLAHVWRSIGYGRDNLPKQKLDYMLADWTRFAALQGVPLRQPRTFPIDAKLARLVFYRLEGRDPALARRFALAAMARYWGQGETITEVADLSGIAQNLRIDVRELEAAQSDAEAKQKQIEAGNLAVQKGVFGTPFFFIGDEGFWGADRIDHLDRWLSGRAGEAAA